MDRLRAAQTKLKIIRALSTPKGGLELPDPSYDGAEEEPKDYLPPSGQQALYGQPYGHNYGQTYGQTYGQNSVYYSAQPSLQPQSTINIPVSSYNAFATHQNYQSPGQNFNTLQQQTPLVPAGYDTANQQHLPQTPVNSSVIQDNSYSSPSTDSHSQYQQSLPQNTPGLPPQSGFSPPQRSASDNLYRAQSPQPFQPPFQRSQTLPNHSQIPHYSASTSERVPAHDCNANIHPYV